MKRPWLPALAVFLAWGCVERLPQPDHLIEPRILAVVAEPPALVPPGAVTLTVHWYDPAWRPPVFVRWYLVRAEGGFDELVDRFAASWARTPGGWFFVGEGTTVTVPLPDPLELGLEPDLYAALPDVLPLRIAVVVGWSDLELKALKGVRLVLPELVARTLERELGRPATVTELAEAVALRRNRNPRLAGWLLARVPAVGAYDPDEMLRIDRRRAVTGVPLARPWIEVDDGRALRIVPRLYDPDREAFDVPRGQPGYNRLEGDFAVPGGELFPLSLTATDWLPVRLEQKTLLEEPRWLPWTPPPIVGMHLSVVDHQGGSTYRPLDFAWGDPPVWVRTAGVALLFGDSWHLTWLAAPATMATTFAAPATEVQFAVRWYAAKEPPLGATGVVVGPVTAVGSARSLDWILRDLEFRRALATGPRTEVVAGRLYTVVPQ